MAGADQTGVSGSPPPPGRWRTANACLYRTGHRLQALLQSARRRPDARGRHPQVAGVLYLAWGRLGDAILASGYTADFRKWSDGPVVAVGRPETGPILQAHADRFVPWPAGGTRGPAWAAFLAQVPARAAVVLGDLHLFHGGRDLARLADAVDSPAVFAHAGWSPALGAAGRANLPASATILHATPRPPGVTDPALVHISRDLHAYHAAIQATLGLPALPPTPLPPALPQALRDPAVARGFGLTPGAFLACQPASSQGKKDYPADRWQAVLADCTAAGIPVVLLGTAADRAQAPLAGLTGITDLRGHTRVAEAIALAASARAFAGVDSGLGHAAAAAGVPAVIAHAQASTGCFFPYPEGLVPVPPVAVRDAGHAACAGCHGLCQHEPIWRSRAHGLRCLRHLTAGTVRDAVLAAWHHSAEVTPAGIDPAPVGAGS